MCRLCSSGEVGLAEVAKLFEKSTLLELKNECGGLQTLLRNHYYIFKGQFNLECFDVAKERSAVSWNKPRTFLTFVLVRIPQRTIITFAPT